MCNFTKAIFLGLLFISNYNILLSQESRLDYYPLEEGIEWKYQASVKSQMGSGSTIFRMKNFHQRELDDILVTPQKTDQGGSSSFIFCSKDVEGVFEYAKQAENDIDPVIHDNPEYLIKYPIETGTTWADESETKMLIENIPITITSTVVSINEIVTVPAGTFEKCIKIRNSGTATKNIGNLRGEAEIKVECYEWFAPNIGLVKMILNESTSQLFMGGGQASLQLDSIKLNTNAKKVSPITRTKTSRENIKKKTESIDQSKIANSSSDVSTNQDAIINDLNNLAANAYQYRIRPTSLDGGNGSYTGYKIPEALRSNDNASYTSQANSDNVKFLGISSHGYGAISTTCDGVGKLGDFSYTCKFYLSEATTYKTADEINSNSLNSINDKSDPLTLLTEKPWTIEKVIINGQYDPRNKQIGDNTTFYIDGKTGSDAKWKFSDDYQKIIWTPSKGKETVFTIIELTKYSLKLKYIAEGLIFNRNMEIDYVRK